MFVEENFITIFLIGFTNNVTGSVFVTFLVLFLLIMAFFMAFRVPPLYSMVFVLPLALVIMSFYSSFIVVGGALLIYLGFSFATHYFLYG